MAAAKLFELNEEQTTWAIGHAASMAAGVRASLGTMTKPLHVGWAAARGIEAALLARTGIDGSADALDGPWGSLTVAGSGADAAGPGADVNLVTGRFGNPFILADPGVSAKPYPCGSVTHPGMDALKRAMAEYELTADDIARIVVSAGSNVWGPISYPFAATTFEAKYSFPFLLAAIALTGGAGRAQFREDFIQSDACVAFQKKVEIRHDEVLDAMSTDVVHTRLDIDTRDGRTTSIDARADYPGGPKVPMDDQGVNQSSLMPRTVCLRLIAGKLSAISCGPLNRLPMRASCWRQSVWLRSRRKTAPETQRNHDLCPRCHTRLHRGGGV